MLIPFCPIGLGGGRYLIAMAVWPNCYVPYMSAGHVDCS